MSRQWQPLVTRAAVAMEISTAMMNQPCQGKHLPDNVYFMIFNSRGNNKDKKMTKGDSERRNTEPQEIETETESEGDGEKLKQRAGTRQSATPPLISLDVTLQSNK